MGSTPSRVASASAADVADAGSAIAPAASNAESDSFSFKLERKDLVDDRLERIQRLLHGLSIGDLCEASSTECHDQIICCENLIVMT